MNLFQILYYGNIIIVIFLLLITYFGIIPNQSLKKTLKNYLWFYLLHIFLLTIIRLPTNKIRFDYLILLLNQFEILVTVYLAYLEFKLVLSILDKNFKIEKYARIFFYILIVLSLAITGLLLFADLPAYADLMKAKETVDSSLMRAYQLSSRFLKYTLAPALIYFMIKLVKAFKSENENKRRLLIAVTLIANMTAIITLTLSVITRLSPGNGYIFYLKGAAIISNINNFILLFLIVKLVFFEKAKATSPVSNDKIDDNLTKIESAFSDDSIVTNPNMNLQIFSQKIGLSPPSISYVLNKSNKDSFKNLLTYARIEFAKSKLNDSFNDKLTLEAIAHQSGFKTRETFARKFKEVTSLSPSEYKKKRNM